MLISNNIEFLNDSDEIVTYLYVTGCLYNGRNRLYRGSAFWTNCSVNNKDGVAGYYKQALSDGFKEGWVEFKITIGELKLLTEISKPDLSNKYAYNFLSEILAIETQPKQNCPIYIYSCELHKTK